WTAFQNDQLWAGIDAEPGNDNAAIHIHTGSNFNDGQWHHYALVRDLVATPDRLCLYLDGDSTCYTSGTNAQWHPVSADIRPVDNKNGNDNDNSPVYAIGSRTSGGNGLTATIDELRISDVARYRSNFTPTVAPFSSDNNTVMLFHFNEGSGNQTLGLSSSPGLALTGTLVKSWQEYGEIISPLDPNNSAEAAHLSQMWVDGRFGTTSGPPAQSLNLISPNGGELWQTGSEHPITWQTTPGVSIAEVNLVYSTDGFISSHTIVTSAPNTGVFTWTTPVTPSNTTQVRVTDVVSSSAYDDSDATFILIDTIYSTYLPTIIKD
ncbi:MAG: hypothetical protein HYR94_04035, partial [Chloroflexi bacterium]|nr:hypothetical protein [Chloroflexota bacterium]